MPRIKPQIGQTYVCGTITAIEKSAGKNRAIRVEVRCVHCSTIFSERFTKVRSGERKSCGCKKRDGFKAYWEKRANRMSKALRNQIFEHHELHGGYSTAKLFNIPRYLATTVWLLQRRFISASRPASVLASLANQMLKMSNAGISRKLGFTQGMALAICRIARTVARKLTVHATEKAFRRYHPKLIDNIDYALAVATCEVSPAYAGELRPSDLSRTKKSTFGWLYRVLSQWTPDALNDVPGVREFMSICEYSFKQRSQRRQAFIRRWVRQNA